MPYTAALRVLNSAIQEGSIPSIAKIGIAILNANLTLEWRNWQTHGTQNPASFTGYEGSTPSSSTSTTRRGQPAAASGYFRRAVTKPRGDDSRQEHRG